MPSERSASQRPRDVPAYPVAEAARYLRLAPATLRSWVIGRPYATARGPRHFPPLIRLADARRTLLSFNNLVEAHVLRALRTEHGVSIRAVREALRYAQRELGIEQLLLSRDLTTSAGELFVERYGQLISLGHAGQLALKSVLEAHLRRLDRGEGHWPVRLFPFVRGELGDAPRLIAIDPRVAFGRPVLADSGVSTRIIADRVDAGETLDEVAADYGIGVGEVEEAIVYERAA